MSKIQTQFKKISKPIAKKNMGKSTCIFLHPPKKNANVVSNGYVFFRGCKKLLEPL
jgi:hypothetical protein